MPRCASRNNAFLHRSERQRDWYTRFGVEFGLKIVQLTGDRDVRHSVLAEADIVITTPEKWDAIRFVEIHAPTRSR
jgi:hypothetical protein